MMENKSIKNLKNMIRLHSVIMLFFISVELFAQTAEQQIIYKKLNKYYNGIYKPAKEDSTLTDIYNQLVSYSGMQYYIYITNNFKWGHAHNRGIILIDSTILSKPKEVLSYVIAHEWGHVILGHQANLFNTSDNNWDFSISSIDIEAEADRYAGKFLAVKDYNISVVIEFLMYLPASAKWHTHTSGTESFTNVFLKGYKSIKNTSIESNDINIMKLNDVTNTIKCSHPSHPAGDAYPCIHTCYNQLSGEKIQCHPNGDVTDCNHPLHPNNECIKR